MINKGNNNCKHPEFLAKGECHKCYLAHSLWTGIAPCFDTNAFMAACEEAIKQRSLEYS